mmetsp:Transcript_40557/g.108807  ORF Transcript_40557/g.108807 Transcript_40557/m.108807 type:complete len:304 (-) Transcript_40557:771-1682(-)
MGTRPRCRASRPRRCPRQRRSPARGTSGCRGRRPRCPPPRRRRCRRRIRSNNRGSPAPGPRSPGRRRRRCRSCATGRRTPPGSARLAGRGPRCRALRPRRCPRSSSSSTSSRRAPGPRCRGHRRRRCPSCACRRARGRRPPPSRRRCAAPGPRCLGPRLRRNRRAWRTPRPSTRGRAGLCPWRPKCHLHRCPRTPPRGSCGRAEPGPRNQPPRLRLRRPPRRSPPGKGARGTAPLGKSGRTGRDPPRLGPRRRRCPSRQPSSRELALTALSAFLERTPSRGSGGRMDLHRLRPEHRLRPHRLA